MGSFCPGSGCSSTAGAGAGAGRGTLLPSTQQTSIPQLVSYSCLAATMGQSVMTLSRLCPCPHTTYNIQHNPTHGAQPVVGLAAGRAGQRSQSCSSAPRPGPPRPQHGTRHGLSFSLSAPGPPQPGRGAVRVPHSALARPHISCSPLAGHHAVTAGPQQGHHHPLLRVRLQEAWRGRGPAGGSPAQPPPGHRSAGQGGPGPALAAHNNSPTAAERENPRKNTIRTTFAHLTHHNLGRGHSRAGWARLGSLHCLGRDIFWSLAQSLKHSPVSRCRGAALGFAGLTAGTAAA